MEAAFPKYRIDRDYRWNYEHAPDPIPVRVPSFPGDWTFVGKPVDSPLGIPAGPLLNGRWIIYYAGLGFDILTYKTVRSGVHPCYEPPNLVPVRCESLTGKETVLEAAPEMSGSWAVSFGMPSASPDVWRADIEATRERLGARQVLVVSVVGTVQPGWSIDDLAADYAQCARWAVESGADAVEANLSCPNVESRDGQLYREPEAAGRVAAALRDAIGKVPLILKLGHVVDPGEVDRLLVHVAPHADALAMTNSVAAQVRDAEGRILFGGARRGICGAATREASLSQTRLFQQRIARGGWDVKLIGVGGISNADHVRAYLDAGAETVQIATAAMVDPIVAWRIREDYCNRSRDRR